jgi:hypothetical protein
MPQTTQTVPISYTTNNIRGKISIQVTDTNAGINGIIITGALQIDPDKYAAGKGLIECLDLSSLPTPNFPDPDDILPIYTT